MNTDRQTRVIDFPNTYALGNDMFVIFVNPNVSTFVNIICYTVQQLFIKFLFIPIPQV